MKLVLKLSPARLPRFEQISVDSTALLFTFGISLVAGFAFGVIPVLKHGRSPSCTNLYAPEDERERRPRTQHRAQYVDRRSGGLALVLLIGSGLMIRTFQSMRRVHPGFSSSEDTADAAHFHPTKCRSQRCRTRCKCITTWSTAWQAFPECRRSVSSAVCR